MTKLPLLFLLIMTACAREVPIREPVNVDIPVAISCHITNIAEPDWNMQHMTADARPADKLKAILADLELSKGYIAGLRAELAACS